MLAIEIWVKHHQQKPTVESSTIDGLTIVAIVVFSQSYEKPSRLGYVLWPSALHDCLVYRRWSQRELFPNYPQHSYITITCTSPSSRLAYLTRVWIHLLGSIHTLLNPHTCELLYLSSSPRSALSSSLHLSRPRPSRERCKMEIKHLIEMLVFGEGL